MNCQYKVTYSRPSVYIHMEITHPDQVFILKTKVDNMGGLTEEDLTLEVECADLESELLEDRFYVLGQGIPDESSNNYTAYLKQMYIEDQVFEIEPKEFSNHPIYEVFKELEQHFCDPKIIFDNGLKFTAKLC